MSTTSRSASTTAPASSTGWPATDGSCCSRISTPPDELAWLRAREVQPLGYLSLSEDQGPPAPWQRPERNPDWGGAFVHVGHPGWVEHVVGQAKAAMDGRVRRAVPGHASTSS